MNTPLYNKISEYIERQPGRFHMPSHNGKEINKLYASAPYDITELDFSDNLSAPVGVIKKSEELVAARYGSKKTLFYTSGATTALHVAIGTATSRGDTVIMARNCHKSVYSAVRLFGLKPYYIFPEIKDGLYAPVTSEDVLTAIKKCPKAKAIIITSPDYFGRTVKTEVADVVRKSGKILIVDEAHGGHFVFSDKFPKSFSALADFSVESLHKTLPVFTGGAILNINNESLYNKTVVLSSDLNTSSPSYITMASIDYATAYFEKNGKKLYDELYSKLSEFKAKESDIFILPNDDFSRLVIRGGSNIYQKLIEEGIYPEAVYGDYIIFIVTPFNMDNLNRLFCVLKDYRPELTNMENYNFAEPILGMNGDNFETVLLEKAVGRTAYSEIGIYPPGVPIVAHGEIITEQAVRIISQNTPFGLASGQVCVIIEKK